MHQPWTISRVCGDWQSKATNKLEMVPSDWYYHSVGGLRTLRVRPSIASLAKADSSLISRSRQLARALQDNAHGYRACNMGFTMLTPT